jgi:hypothetical protein
MFNTNAELVFPSNVIPDLREARGPIWQDLVTATAKKADSSIEQTAFALMMAKLNNCSCCNSDSYRSIQGCSACSQQTLKRFRGPDEELLKLYESAHIEVTRFLHKP